MNITKYRLTAMVIVSSFAIYPHSAFAEKFTGKTFSQRSVESQNGFIQTSVTMAGVVATQVKPEISRCINDWYFAGNGIIEQRNEMFRKTIAQYESAHPSGVILALIQNQCGKFKSD